MTDWTAADYQALHSIVFATDADGRPRYPGYRPEVVELPNGDGRADREKRYAHVSRNNQAAIFGSDEFSADDWLTLDMYLDRAHAEALRVARALNVPAAFRPDIRYSALRVLEYPPGATSARHTDFDLFTLLCYRDRPEGLVRYADEVCLGYNTCEAGLDDIAPGLHIGELGEIVGLGPATPHEVRAIRLQNDRDDGPVPSDGSDYFPQHSIVYFAIPDHAAALPSGQTVRQWLDERIGRSRAAR